MKVYVYFSFLLCFILIGSFIFKMQIMYSLHDWIHPFKFQYDSFWSCEVLIQSIYSETWLVWQFHSKNCCVTQSVVEMLRVLNAYITPIFYQYQYQEVPTSNLMDDSDGEEVIYHSDSERSHYDPDPEVTLGLQTVSPTKSLITINDTMWFVFFSSSLWVNYQIMA